MGQRLVINIQKNNKSIATAYYHWSGYTFSSAEITAQAIDKYYQLKEENPQIDDLNLAVEMLYATEAGLTDDAINHFGTQITNITHAINRNCGLIDLTPEEMENSISWAEGLATLDLDNEMVDWDVFFFEGDKEQFEEVKEDYDLSIEYDDIPDLDRNCSPVNFEEFPSIVEEIYESSSKFGGYFKMLGDIYCTIE